MITITVRDIKIGGGELVLIAGPCIIESISHARMMAGSLKEITAAVGIPFIFKASFDKANRSSINALSGPRPCRRIENSFRDKRRVRYPL